MKQGGAASDRRSAVRKAGGQAHHRKAWQALSSQQVQAEGPHKHAAQDIACYLGQAQHLRAPGAKINPSSLTSASVEATVQLCFHSCSYAARDELTARGVATCANRPAVKSAGESIARTHRCKPGTAIGNQGTLPRRSRPCYPITVVLSCKCAEHCVMLAPFPWVRY